MKIQIGRFGDVHGGGGGDQQFAGQRPARPTSDPGTSDSDGGDEPETSEAVFIRRSEREIEVRSDEEFGGHGALQGMQPDAPVGALKRASFVLSGEGDVWFC